MDQSRWVSFILGVLGVRKAQIYNNFCCPAQTLDEQTLHEQYVLISNHFLNFEGNVYIGDQPVCDDGWGSEEARVACRS